MQPVGCLSRFGVTLLGILPISLFIGMMIATAGIAIHPPIAFIATPLVCSGEVEVESQNYSYRPGQQGVTRTIWCESESATGDKPTRDDITFKAMGAALLVYSAIAFALLQLLWMMLRPKVTGLFRRRVESVVPGAAFGGSGVDLQSILSQVADAVERADGKVSVRNMSVDMRDHDGPADDEEPAERLARLKQLYDQGLITAAEYQSKRAQILSEL